MKIAIFSDCYLDLTGGIVTSIDAQKSELEARGHTVYVFSSAYPKTESELKKLEKNHIYPVPSCKFWGRGLAPIARKPPKIEQFLIENFPELENFDIFYVHYEAGCSIAGLNLAKKFQKPSVQVMHGREDMGVQSLIPYGFRTLVGTALNWLHSWYLPHPTKIPRDNYLAPTRARAAMWALMVNHANAADLVLTPSEHFRKKLKHYGVTKPLKVLPNGVPDRLFTPQKPRELAPGEPLEIIWHSRVSKEKRILPFLEALRLLSVTGKTNGAPTRASTISVAASAPYHLSVYGDGDDLSRARRYAARHHLNVTFYGPTPFDKIFEKIAHSHLDVMTSFGFDTFGMTLIEAETAGTPVLYVDPDMSEIVPSRGGILTKDPFPSAIAAALQTLLSSPSKIRAMSEQMLSSRDSVRVSARVSARVDLLESLLQKAKPPR